MSRLTSSIFSQASGTLLPNNISNGRLTDFKLKQFQCATIITYFFWLHLFLMIIFLACQSNLYCQPRLRGRGGSEDPEGWLGRHCHLEVLVQNWRSALRRVWQLSSWNETFRPPAAAEWVKETRTIPSVSLKQNVLCKSMTMGVFSEKGFLLGPKKGDPLRNGWFHLENAFLHSSFHYNS